MVLQMSGSRNGRVPGAIRLVKKLIERPGRGAAKPATRAATPGPAAKAPAVIDDATLLGDMRTLVQAARERSNGGLLHPDAALLARGQASIE
jgi:hypothetical protein